MFLEEAGVSEPVPTHLRPPGEPEKDTHDVAQHVHSGNMVSIHDEIKHSYKTQIAEARRTLHAARNAFNEVRNRYSERLNTFHKSKANGEIQDSRTDFDLNYFVVHGNANRKIVQAEAQLDDLWDVARGVGALEVEEITSNFRTRSDDGYAESVVQEDARRTDVEKVQAWIRDTEDTDGQTTRNVEEAAPLPSAENMDDEDIDGSVSVHSSCTLNRYAGGRHKKKIDGWKKRQEKARQEADKRRVVFLYSDDI